MAADAASPTAATAVAGDEAPSVERFMRKDIEEMIAPPVFKAFCKRKCAECGEAATKRFNKSMPLMVKSMIETFWCPECGRLLCEKHRHQHTCELLDQQKERNKRMTKEQIAAEIAEAEARREAEEEKQKAAKRIVAEADDAQRRQRKEKRKIMASKAKTVDDFVQAMSRRFADTASGGRSTAVRDELFELYGQAKRLSLTLYNEYEDPTIPGLPEEDYEAVKTIYRRATEITGMFASVDGQPLEMRNPWDAPPTPEEAREA
eukprot:TRINITY_DN29331_c0_g2_i1.p1 TRINITY_DN29331_c0_g2~~TRINITY_DN29331_c0_g2_i1.p1  ORF type:complete len:285 (-),score=73.65 TRINITY_DN29331_c0_g2_i1:273-1058(-)